MDRRTFIKQTSIASIGLNLPMSTVFEGDEEVVTILHTNDMHSRIEPFPSDNNKYGGMGGMAKRATLINSIRKATKNVLLLDAGDIFQGTPYFNFFGGELEFKLMSKMGYDAATIGNHDFDNGIEGLAKMLPHANFPFLSANYDFSRNQLKRAFEPYKIFEKGKIKIGVFGLGIQLEGLVNANLTKGTKFIDPVGVAKEMVESLKQKGCDLIICLSHLGHKYKGNKLSDHSIAEKVDGIDLIIGGHTHTFLDEPLVYTNKAGHDTLINQVGWAGLRMGRIDFHFKKRRKFAHISKVIPVA